MEDKKDINCDELTKKMNECLQQGDNDKCKDVVEEFNNLCKEEKGGLLSWLSGKSDKEEEEKEEEKKDDDKEE